MNEKEKILSELYEKSCGQNVARLISDFEANQAFKVKLQYRDVYKLNEKIIITVFDEISETQFELVYNEDSCKLVLYYED